MNKEENTKKLKMALTEHKSIDVYLDNEFYCQMIYSESEQKYQCQFGTLDLEDVIKAVNGCYSHLKIEVSE